MDAVAAPIVLERRVAPEEAARGDFYALLARLFHAAPDDALLASLAAAPQLDARSPLAAPWRDVCLASSAIDEDAAREEYEALFVGIGKADVSLYAGFYAGAPAADHPRVRIRRDLAALGLAPRDDRAEPEDHFAALFDAMRVLTAGGAGRGPASVAEQRRFFEEHIAPAVPRFCATVEGAPAANYYRRVAQLAAAFVAFETESFALE